MNSNVHNIKTSISNVVGLVTTTIRVTTQVTADASGVLVGAVEAVPGTTKALAQSPCAAGMGYILEREKDKGTTPEEAHKRAYAIVERPLAESVTAVAIATGAGLAMMWDDVDNTNVDNTSTGTSEEQPTVTQS